MCIRDRYIINQGMGVGAPAPALPWKKIRILRKGNGYLIQHADINANTFSEITVNKNDAYNFQYIDFEKGVVTVDPPKDKWDICWTGFTNLTNLGAGLVPYYFQDVIVQNTYKVQTAQILNTTKSYENFGAADLSALDFGCLLYTSLSLKPGLRLIYNSVYDAPAGIPSLNLKWDVNPSQVDVYKRQG